MRRQDERKDKRRSREIRCVMCVVVCYVQKLPDPRIISNFQNYPVANPEHDFFPCNFLFVRLHIKIFSNYFGNHFPRHGTSHSTQKHGLQPRVNQLYYEAYSHSRGHSSRFHKMVPGSSYVHFVWYSALNHNSTRRPPSEGRKNEHCGGRGKKNWKFWVVQRREVRGRWRCGGGAEEGGERREGERREGEWERESGEGEEEVGRGGGRGSGRTSTSALPPPLASPVDLNTMQVTNMAQLHSFCI